MTDSSSTSHGLFGFVPRRGPALGAFVAVIAAAFILGRLFSGVSSGNSEQAQHNNGEPTSTIWTCSMHPQIRLPEPGKCPICFMDLIPVTTDEDESIDPNQLRMTAAAAMLAQVQTAPVRRARAEAELRLYGRVTYDETRLAQITAWAPGRLDKLYVDFTGATIDKGEPLVSMYSPELLAAREEMVQAERAVAGDGGKVLKATAQATLEAARKKLRLYGLTEEQVRHMEMGHEVDDHLTVFSPASGIVVDKNAVEGMYVMSGTRLFTIADLSRLWVVFDAYETDLPWLSVGQSVSFTTRSLPGEVFEATITFVDPTLRPATRTTGVRAEVDNAAGLLKPDMFAHGVISARLDAAGSTTGKGRRKATEEPLLIPATAPLITGRRAVVYVERSGDEDRLFEGREVVLGPRAGDYYIVTEGLQEGEMVVTNGAFKIDAELQIRAKPSMMTGSGGAPKVRGQSEPGDEPAGATGKPGRHEPVALDAQAVMILSPIYDAYFRLQEALASDDLKAATTAAEGLVSAISVFDHTVFPGSVHWPWTEHSSEIARQAMAAAGGTDIESVRASFEMVSKGVIDLHSVFGHADGRVYYLTYCPMAFNNKGAYWLQTDSIINNPYFGASMLRCGEIRDRMASMDVGE